MEAIAQVYSRSLFEVASQQNHLELVREQLGQLADALSESEELKLFCFSPYFSTEEKKAGLMKAIDGADPAVENFLMLLTENQRLPVIFRVREEFDRLCDEAEDLLAVTVTSAVTLDPAEQRVADRNFEQSAGALDDVAFNNLCPVAEQHGTDVVGFEVQREASYAVWELEHLQRLAVFEPVNAGDSVADRQHCADLGQLSSAGL